MSDIKKLPVIEEFETALPPAELFEAFKDENHAFFLDSGMNPERLGRFSLMGSDPFMIVQSRGDEISIQQGETKVKANGHPLEILGKCLDLYRIPREDIPVPCCGGAVGYLSYDIGRYIEELPEIAVDDLQLPESYFALYDVMLIVDNLEKKTWLVSSGFPETENEARVKRAEDRITELKQKLGNIRNTENKPTDAAVPEKFPEIRSNFTREAYINTVEKARQYIIDGDIFEVNLSQRFEADIQTPPYKLYQNLRKINPAPFAAYLNYPDFQVISSSPERFLKLNGDRVETRPIKGTIRRGTDPQEDRANADTLLSSEKDLAENMMIVDLERNDLGRVCRFGSIKVSELAVLETFPTVFHLTSTIEGNLNEGMTRIDLLKAVFPGGSISGAPKIRAMEIIDELEPTRRSVYTGSIGYFSFDGDIDLNIVIRTIITKNGKVYFQSGGAVVFDSDPEAEYRETLYKASAMMKALQAVEIQ